MLLGKVFGEENKLERVDNGNVYKLNGGYFDIFIISDFHIDFKMKRPNYFGELMGYMDNLIYKMESSVNPVCIFLGDIFDRDLNKQKGILFYEVAAGKFKRINKICEGRVFTVLGNHECTYINKIPTFLLTECSPHLLETLRANDIKFNREQGSIIKTPREIWVGDTKITLHHFRKDGKYNLKDIIKPKYRVDLFHDTFVSFTLKENVNKGLPVGKIWSKSLKDYNMSNIDLAIFGDFHIPLPTFRISNSKNTRIVTPGSFGRNNYNTETHGAVQLPIISVRPDGTELNVESFKLANYKESYNVVDKESDLIKYTNKIKKSIEEAGGGFGVTKISLDNYLEYIIGNYGEESYGKIYNLLKGGK